MGREGPETWLKVIDDGLYCIPGGFYIDPVRPVERALITHGHADHARPNHRAVLATPETLAIMRQRYREGAGTIQQPVAYGESIDINGVRATFYPAGHILGSSQILLEYGGFLFAGQRDRDVPPADSTQVDKLRHALALNPDRCVLVGAYSLGKCQRLIRLLRESGHDEPIYLHGAMVGLCALYQELGIDLGPLETVAEATRGAREKESLKGKVILCPPSAVNDRWSRRLPDPITAMASGWMLVRARARQKQVELPLVVSDHADWDELTQTIREVRASEIWVTHGRDDALVHYAGTIGLKARPLDLRGYEEDEET